MEDLLELDTRRRLFEFLERFPGLHLRELERQLELDVRTLRHHLDFLERHDAVTVVREEGYVRYFPRAWEEGYFRERIGASEKRLLALLRQRVPLQIVLLLVDEGEMDTDALREATDLAASTLSYHLTKLRKAGLVTYRREGHRRFYRLGDPEGVVQLLVRYRPTTDLIDEFVDLWDQIGL